MWLPCTLSGVSLRICEGIKEDRLRRAAALRSRGSTCGMPLSRMDLAHSGPASGVESSSHVTHASAQPVSRGALHARSRALSSACWQRSSATTSPVPAPSPSAAALCMQCWRPAARACPVPTESSNASAVLRAAKQPSCSRGPVYAGAGPAVLSQQGAKFAAETGFCHTGPHCRRSSTGLQALQWPAALWPVHGVCPLRPSCGNQSCCGRQRSPQSAQIVRTIRHLLRAQQQRAARSGPHSSVW
jgi:hypothetical protein